MTPSRPNTSILPMAGSVSISRNSYFVIDPSPSLSWSVKNLSDPRVSRALSASPAGRRGGSLGRPALRSRRARAPPPRPATCVRARELAGSAWPAGRQPDRLTGRLTAWFPMGQARCNSQIPSDPVWTLTSFTNTRCASPSCLQCHLRCSGGVAAAWWRSILLPLLVVLLVSFDSLMLSHGAFICCTLVYCVIGVSLIACLVSVLTTCV